MANKPIDTCLQSICRIVPLDVSTELTTALQDIYNRTLNGGHGSRKAVIHTLLVLGLHPNK